MLQNVRMLKIFTISKSDRENLRKKSTKWSSTWGDGFWLRKFLSWDCGRWQGDRCAAVLFLNSSLGPCWFGCWWREGVGWDELLVSLHRAVLMFLTKRTTCWVNNCLLFTLLENSVLSKYFIFICLTLKLYSRRKRVRFESNQNRWIFEILEAT